MFRMTITFKKDKKIDKVSKTSMLFDTFIEACHMAEDFGEDSIIEVLIIKQNLKYKGGE